MLTKDNNKSLFKNPKFEKNINKIDELYISQENNINKLKQIIKEKDNIVLKNKMDYNDLYEENKMLKIQLKEIKKDTTNFMVKNIQDDLIYIDFDVFKYESDYILKSKVNDYEKQLDILNCFFNDNNINSLSELKTILSSFINTNNYFYLNKKLDNINLFLNDIIINSKSQKIKMNELLCNFEHLNNKMKIIKNKINKLPIGTVIKINGVKKIFKGKTEKVISKIKKMEEEFEEYCQNQIDWAKGVLGDNIKEKQIIMLLDILYKINNKKYSSSSETESKISNIVIKAKKAKYLEFESYSELGKTFINNNINFKKDIKKEDLLELKEIIKSSDLYTKGDKKDDKTNRFINTCKRLYKISQIITIETIVNSNIKTSIRDINNQDFDLLLNLLENKKE